MDNPLQFKNLRIFPVVLLSFIFSTPVLCEITDTTIFSGSFEKNVFYNFDKGTEVDTLGLLALSGPSDKEKLKGYVQKIKHQLNAMGIKNASLKKQIGTIHKTIHSTYLNKYDEKCFVNGLYETGSYNCVTASSLYAIIFSYYRIPFVVKEKPDHVYIEVIGDKKNVKIETLFVKDGIIQYDDRFKKKYVDFLNGTKIISDYEMRLFSVDTLFNRHYNKDRSINLVELAGLQYYNKCYFLMEKSEYEDALKNVEKAEILYPASTTIKYLKNEVLELLLHENNAKKNFNGKTIAKYLNNNPQSLLVKQNGLELFRAATNELMVNRPDLGQYALFYNDFESTVSDTINIDDFKQIYHLLFAYNQLLQLQIYPAIMHLKEAQALNPENIAVNAAIVEVTGKYLFSGAENKFSIDSVDKYLDFFPFLEEHNQFNKYLILAYGTTSMRYLEDGDTEKSEHYMDKFEFHVSRRADFPGSEEIISSLYKEMAYYYIQRRNIEKAREITERGLKNMEGSEILTELKYDLNKFDLLISSAIKGKAVYKPIVFTVDNKKTINNNVKAHLKKCWYSEKTFVEDHYQTIPLEKRTLLIFETGKVKMIKEHGDISGTWKYDANECMITITEKKVNARERQFKILEMNSGSIKLIMYDAYKGLDGDIYLFKPCK